MAERRRLSEVLTLRAEYVFHVFQMTSIMDVFRIPPDPPGQRIPKYIHMRSARAARCPARARACLLLPALPLPQRPRPPLGVRAAAADAAAAAAALHLQVLVVGRVRVRVGVPLLGLLLVAGGLQLVLQVESLVAVDELVGDGVPHRPARRRLDRAVDRPVALGSGVRGAWGA